LFINTHLYKRQPVGMQLNSCELLNKDKVNAVGHQLVIGCEILLTGVADVRKGVEILRDSK